jgi:hypothetical protein
VFGPLCVAVLAFPAAAQWFDIPEGFVARPATEEATAKDWRPLLIVQPEDGPFAALSIIRLAEVTKPVGDPDAWLKARLSIGEEGWPSAEDLLNSPDSPFADPAFEAFRQALPGLFQSLQQLGQLPLQMCEGPSSAYNALGSMRELYCSLQVGPVRQYGILRLQQVGTRWFYTEIRAMNERRLRHLLAIANSFHVDG